MTKVLVVDDSAITRNFLQRTLTSAGFEVLTANNGQECLDRISVYKPDVVTLDINMPVMNGLACLKLLMEKHPTPVVMVSSLTEQGAVETFEALELGAVDYFPKPAGSFGFNMGHAGTLLVSKVRSAAHIKVNRRTSTISRNHDHLTLSGTHQTRTVTTTGAKIELVLIGVSTGGPGALQQILTRLPADFPVPIVIAQHMPARFTSVFAERLNKICAITVSEVATESSLLPGNVYVARGDADIKIVRRGGRIFAQSITSHAEFLWHPSVEYMIESASTALDCSKQLLIQLTGMGNDGAKAMKNSHTKGATTIAESEDSCVVFGMPKELIALGGADKILHVNQIADELLHLVKR